jgi:iron complex outermembrane receptor protein
MCLIARFVLLVKKVGTGRHRDRCRFLGVLDRLRVFGAWRIGYVRAREVALWGLPDMYFRKCVDIEVWLDIMRVSISKTASDCCFSARVTQAAAVKSEEVKGGRMTTFGCKAAVLAIAACVGAAVSNVSASAPVGGSEADASGSQGDALQEIIVTAQKRTENLEDVPIAVTPISGDALKDLRVETARDLQFVVPGIVYSQAGGTTETYLRGVGNNITEVNADPSIATYVDGVYVSSSAVTAVQMADIQSIEVLKGPQGTLYGRNATGGAINITTQSPTNQLDAHVTAGIGNYSESESGISVSGPIIGDTLLGGIYGTYVNHIPYSTLNDPPGTVDPAIVRSREQQGTARTKLLFEPASWVTFTLAGDFTKYASFEDMAWRQLQSNATGYSKGAPPNYGEYSASLNDPVDEVWQSAGGSLRTVLDLGQTTLTELSAYREYTTYWAADSDVTNAPLSFADDYSVSNQWSHEIDWQSKSGSKFQWTLGAMYYTDNGGQYPFAVLPPPVLINIQAGVNDTSYAGFGQGTLSLTDALRLTVGARYTWEQKAFLGGYTAIFLPNGKRIADDLAAPTGHTWTNFSPKVGLDYRFGDTLAYVSYSEGFKSGIYNLTGSTPASLGPVNPEILDAYEIGTKSELLDKRLRLNTSLFYYDYSNLQVQTLTPQNGVPTATYQNAATVYSTGLDLDATWIIIPDVQLRVLSEFLRSHYGSFDAFDGYTRAAVGNATVTENVSGYTAARTPGFSGNFGGDYVMHLPKETNLKWTLNLYHTNGFAFNPDHTAYQNTYNTLELSAQIRPDSGRWSVTAWANNLTGTYYYSYKQINQYGLYGVPGAPRTFGITGTWYFGERH